MIAMLAYAALVGLAALSFAGRTTRYLSPETDGGGKTQDGTEDEEEMEDDEEDEEEVEDGEDDEEMEDDAGESQASKPAPVATVADLRRALPKSTPAERESYLAAGLTVKQAKAMHRQHKAVAKRRTPPGGPGVQSGGDTDTDDQSTGVPKHPFIVAAEKRARENGLSLDAAKQEVCHENPELFRAYRETKVDAAPVRREDVTMLSDTTGGRR
jgi:hypothetical protein